MNRSASARSSNFVFDDWDLLFSSVTAELKLVVGETMDATPEPQPDPAPARVQAGVLECVSALGLLQAAMRDEFVRHRRAGALPAPARRAPQGAAVLYVHAGGLAPIDDTHGSVVGGQLSDIVAARLAQSIRQDDTVARLGAEEFACLLEHLPGEVRLRSLSDALRAAVAAPAQVAGELMPQVRPSIGIAVRRDPGTDTSTLLRQARAAMQRDRPQTGGVCASDERSDPRSKG